MKKNKIFLGLLCLIAVYIQISYFKSSGGFYEYGFLIGFHPLFVTPDVGIDMMYVLVPILFIIFLISGTLNNLTNGYGKVLIIRNYSKTRLYLRNYIKIVATTISAVVFQLAVFYFCNDWFIPLKTDLFKSVAMYLVVLNLIITIQYVLELFVATHIANVILFIYSFVSYYAVQITTAGPVMKTLLFPSLLFGMQNGSVDGNPVYNIYLMLMILFNIITVTIGILKFKKTDIF